jgi:Tol biopolymer transport system component
MPGRHVISIVQPDGSGLTELGEGDEPAWSPDGSTIYFRHADQIWRMAADGSGTEPIPGTDGGREPAVSPDGALLAFARESRFGDYDIWVTRLEP